MGWDRIPRPHQWRHHPLTGRTLAIADTIDALATARAYRTPRPPAAIRAELLACRGVRDDPALGDVVLDPPVWSALWADVYPAIPDDLTPSQGAADPEPATVLTARSPLAARPATPLPATFPAAIATAPTPAAVHQVLLRDADPGALDGSPVHAIAAVPRLSPTPDSTAAVHPDTASPP